MKTSKDSRSKPKPNRQKKNKPVVIRAVYYLNNSSDAKKSVISVLHVDDDACFLEVSKQILMMENTFELKTALSADEALSILEKRSFDVIVSDYDMPQKDGLKLLKELREKKLETPFILFTGHGTEEIAIQALNLGADHYINKQGDPETVYGELAHHICIAAKKTKNKTKRSKTCLLSAT